MTDQPTPAWPRSQPSDETSVKHLNPAIESKVLAFCKEGYALYDRGENKLALRKFYSAWTLLPKPQTQWQEAGWVLTALGDAYFMKGDYVNGQQALLSALHCPKCLGNPIIHMRLGQCHYELGNIEQAKQQLQKAMDHGGEKLISSEDPRYLKLLDDSITS